MSNPKDPKPAADAGSCPVPHSARAAWLSDVKASSSSTSCDSTKIDQSLPTGHHHPPPPSSSNSPPRILGVDREISSIPRANPDGRDVVGSNSTHPPHDPKGLTGSSNWIYPSEEMFFNAMKRKDWNPNKEDMRTIVPIHNAVNERAWKEIREWELGMGSEKIMVLLGYQAPFDRHDWTVDRCGKRIDYVIDFYTGKPDPKRPEALSFYLDVRPKMSVEGAWMRAHRWARSLF